MAEPPQQTEQQREQAALREAFELREGLRRLGIMAGVESITRNLEQEDAALKQLDDIHGEFMGSKPAAAQGPDEMRATAARDVTVNYYSGNPQTSTAAPATNGAAKVATAENQPSRLATVLKWGGIAAAVLTGMGGTSALTAYLMKQSPAIVQEAVGYGLDIRKDEVSE